MKRTFVNPVIKDTITFVQTASESGGRVSEAEISLMPGGGNPLHYHKTYAETFTAIEGDLGVNLGKRKTKILKPGESHTVPPMQLHRFFNPTDSVIKFKVELRPGHEGFENSIKILYGLAADGLTSKKSIPKSLKHTALIVTMSDMNVPGFLTLIFPLLKRMARKARETGEEQKLFEKYCL